MNRSYRVLYLLALVLALTPPGLRWLWWQKGHSQPVDPAQAQAGEILFNHDWKVHDPLCAGGDGLGPVFNASSCVACHNQAGPGGGGGLEHNVTTFTIRIAGQTPRQGVVHSQGIGNRETLQDVHASFPPISSPTLDLIVNLNGRGSGHCLALPTGVSLSQRNTPALFGVKLIDEIPDRVIVAEARSQRVRWGLAPTEDEDLPVGRAHRLANGRIGRFGWKAQIGTLSEFVRAACANELGLSNPGQAQPKPIYRHNDAETPALDLTDNQCDELTAFCASLPRPEERLSKDLTSDDVKAGRKLFGSIGCADCHKPNLGSVEGLYSDLLLHQMGKELVGGGSYGEPPVPDPDSPDDDDGSPSPSEWRTPPLWGVADSAPYLHDGRARNLEEAIQLHAGQGTRSARNYSNLSPREKELVVGFLMSLRAPQEAH